MDTIINLDKNFTPFGVGIDYQTSTFPSKFEVNIRLPYINPTDRVIITTRFTSSNDIFLLLLATDACRRLGIEKIAVFIPYLPYARQDRAMIDEDEIKKGEPYQEALSLKVFADLLNSQKYSQVFVLDPHSDVTLALISNVAKISNHKLVEQALKDKKDYLIVCPDAGAEKKVVKLCKAIGYDAPVVMCEKIRDVKTGKLVSVKVHADDLQGKDVYIVDDICDGGGTYIMQGQELRKKNCGKINLVVSHGLFTHPDGAFVLKPYIDHIYTTDSIRDMDTFKDESFVSQYKTQDLYGSFFGGVAPNPLQVAMRAPNYLQPKP